jgi:hypothetical protein
MNMLSATAQASTAMANSSSLPDHEIIEQQGSSGELRLHSNGVLDQNSIFGFKSMLVVQPDFINR